MGAYLVFKLAKCAPYCSSGAFFKNEAEAALYDRNTMAEACPL